MSITTVTAGNVAKASEMNELINSFNTIEVTGNVTISDIDGMRRYRIQGAHTIILPTVADNEGIELWFWNEGDHAAVIDGEGAETLTFHHGGTATTITFAKEGDWLHIVSDGSTWLVIGGYWGYTTATLTDGSGTADAGGAYTDSAFTYIYWYENGFVNFTGWGWVEVDNTTDNVKVDITVPFSFSTVESALVASTGYKATDPSSLLDTLLNSSVIFANMTISDATSIIVTLKNVSANMTNTRRHTFSLQIVGTI